MIRRLSLSALRVVYPYGSIRRVLRGAARGVRYIVEPSMGFTYAFASESFNFSFLRKKLLPGDVVFDIGANRGQLALFFAACVTPSGRVISYEPSPEQYATLLRNIELNELRQVTPVAAALSDRVGTGSLLYDPLRDTENRLADAGAGRMSGDTLVDVELTTVDLWAVKNLLTPTLMKIDVEGGGAAVLRGASSTLARHHPSVYIELHGENEERAVESELMARGYVVETLAGERLTALAGKHNPLWCWHPDGPRR